MDDDYSDEEEAAVYLGEEIPFDNESVESEKSDDNSNMENEIVTVVAGESEDALPVANASARGEESASARSDPSVFAVFTANAIVPSVELLSKIVMKINKAIFT